MKIELYYLNRKLSLVNCETLIFRSFEMYPVPPKSWSRFSGLDECTLLILENHSLFNI